MPQQAGRPVQELGVRLRRRVRVGQVAVGRGVEFHHPALRVGTFGQDAGDGADDVADGIALLRCCPVVHKLKPGRPGRGAKVAAEPLHRNILPVMMRHDGHVLTNIAVVVVDGFEPFELGVLCEVFGTDRTDEGLPGYDFAVVAAEDGPAPVRGRVQRPDAVPPRPAGECRPDRGAGPERRTARQRRLPGRAAGRAAPCRQPGRAGAERVHGRVRARRGRPAGRPRLHDALAVRGPARPDVPERQGRPVGPVRR